MSAIKFEKVAFEYEKHNPVIEDATFDIKKGEFVFLTGNSGSGKTTIIKSLYGAIKPIKGSISVLDFNMNKISSGKLNKLRRSVGVVFQDYKLIQEWNIEKNIMLPLLISGYSHDVCEKQVEKMLNYVKLYHKMAKYPKELSGGEQQRVAVARAISHSPDLIIADEPTGNLDEYSASVVMDLFKKVNSVGTTIVIATHRTPSEFDFDFRHIHISEGKVYAIS